MIFYINQNTLEFGQVENINELSEGVEIFENEESFNQAVLNFEKKMESEILKESIPPDEIPDDKPDIKKEVEFLQGKSVDFIQKRYLKNKINDTGFSVSIIFKELGGTGNGSEKAMAEFINQKLKK